MSKALFIPLQLSLGTFIGFYTSPILAQVTSDGTVNTQVNQNTNNSGARIAQSYRNCSGV
ncbi:MAG: hypothetical protein AAF383_06225 [Cyanobacteria bacterium P01_A01_bin.83]